MNTFVTGQTLCVFELLVHVCTKCLFGVRDFFWESGRAVVKAFCTHGDDAPVPQPDIIDCSSGRQPLKLTWVYAESTMQTVSLALLWSLSYHAEPPPPETNSVIRSEELAASVFT